MIMKFEYVKLLYVTKSIVFIIMYVIIASTSLKQWRVQ